MPVCMIHLSYLTLTNSSQPLVYSLFFPPSFPPFSPPPPLPTNHRLKEHISNPTNNPILIFPEGCYA